MKGLWPRQEMLKQLMDLNRVMTVKGPLMLDVLYEEIYKLRRYRELEYGGRRDPTALW